MTVAVAMPVAAPALAAAATITPNVTTDEYDAITPDSECSLREAVTAANDNADFGGCTRVGTGNDDTVVLGSEGTYTLSLSGEEDANASGDLDVLSGTSSLAIQASGTGQATIDGDTAATDRVLDLHTGSAASLIGLGITGGPADDWAIFEQTTVGAVTISGSRIFENGGGVRLDGFSTTITDTSFDHNNGLVAIFHELGAFTLERSTVDHNTNPEAGAGIAATNTFITTNVINSTVSDNQSNLSGGGIWTHGTLNLRNSTVAGNTADADDADTMFDADDGGGVYGLAGSTINLSNSLIADNVDATTGTGTDDHVYPDCNANGTATSQGYNLIENTAGCTFTPNNDLTGVDPMLGALAANGGPTLTRAVPVGSPANDAGNPATPGGADPNACPGTDQRGLPRGGAAGRCDIGPFEVQDTVPPSNPTSSGSPPPVSSFNLKRAIKKCKKKFPKGPKRKKCIKKARARAGR